jgi:GT2 family glycosyltransferase
MIDYLLPDGVKAEKLENRPVITTPEGGKVVVDRELFELWEFAQGKNLEQILKQYPQQEAQEDYLRASLCCLSEANLLRRITDSTCSKEEFHGSLGELISVIIVSHNSRTWLAECLPSIRDQTYGPLEAVVVDNASTDGSADWVETNYPESIVIRLEKLHAFSEAINIGVERAKGPFYLLLNPDVRLERDAVEQMMAVYREHENCAAVGAKLRLWWAPAFLNGLGNRVGPFSWGTDNGVGHLDLGQFDHWAEIPSACFAAAMISKSAWEAIGPVDEGFPMYYEDSEWSYRARLLGFKIYAAPRAVVYHAFGGRVPTGGERELTPVKLRNVVYGRLRFTIKLLDQDLILFLRNYLIEDCLYLVRSLLTWKLTHFKMILTAWFRILKDLPGILAERRTLLSKRAISDQELFSLQKEMPITLTWRGLPELSRDVIRSQYLPVILEKRTRPMPEFDKSVRRASILIVSHDVVDLMMAGPGIRYLEMAKALSDDLNVTLAVPSETSLAVPGVRLIRYWEDRPESLQILVENVDVILVSGYMVEKFPFLTRTRARVVVDLYDPFVLENLFYYFDESLEDQERLNQHSIRITNQLAHLGDFFICGNDRQRDYWIGVLTAMGRVNPRNYLKDPSLRSLIDVVGIGIPEKEPLVRAYLKGRHPAIPATSRIVLWGGGIWNWLDPLTLVKAWPEVVAAHPDARLVFLGTRHPNPLVPKHAMAEKTERLASETGELGKTILFFEWLSYEDREALLTEADVGVALHPVHVETRYSLRTRVLDYIWARLPILVTEGDITSEWVQEFNIGRVIPAFDAAAAAEGLKEILRKPKTSWKESFEPLHRALRWKLVVAPLRQYCLDGEHAPDRKFQRELENEPDSAWLPAMLARARSIQRSEGTRTLLHRAWRHLQWRLSRI